VVRIIPSTHSPKTTTTPVHDVPIKIDGGFSMGGAALGGNSETNLLGQAILSDVPGRSLAWIAYEATLVVDQSIEHDHRFAFVCAVEGLDRLELPDTGARHLENVALFSLVQYTVTRLLKASPCFSGATRRHCIPSAI